MKKSNKKLILIIEDEKILAQSLMEKLQAEDFNIMIAHGGLEGLKSAITDHPDLILLDLLIPEIDGIEVLKKLRQDSWGKHVKVIILTNLSNSTKVAESMEAGLDGTYEYLIKTDWSLENIVKKIKEKLQ